LPESVRDGAPPGVGHPILAESRTLREMPGGGDWQALIDGDLKLIVSATESPALYDVAGDPNEVQDLAGERPQMVEAMAAKLKQTLAALPAPGPQPRPREVDASTPAALRALGYTE
jgi:hypothetical protein